MYEFSKGNKFNKNKLPMVSKGISAKRIRRQSPEVLWQRLQTTL
jgi:hypothetical protein